MSEEVDKLLKAYLLTKEEVSRAYDALEAAVLAEYPHQVGDRVKVLSGSRSYVGRVTRVRVEVDTWLGTPTIRVKPEIYPIKKDGSTASVGLIFVSYGDEVEPFPEVPEEPAERTSPQEHAIVNGITRSASKWPTKAVLKEKLGIYNPANLSYVYKPSIYIGYSPRRTGRMSQSAFFQVIEAGQSNNPGGHYSEGGNKTFRISFTSKEAALDEAMQWALTRYGIDHWVRDPFGSWQQPEVYDAVLEKVAK